MKRLVRSTCGILATLLLNAGPALSTEYSPAQIQKWFDSLPPFSKRYIIRQKYYETSHCMHGAVKAGEVTGMNAKQITDFASKTCLGLFVPIMRASGTSMDDIKSELNEMMDEALRTEGFYDAHPGTPRPGQLKARPTPIIPSERCRDIVHSPVPCRLGVP